MSMSILYIFIVVLSAHSSVCAFGVIDVLWMGAGGLKLWEGSLDLIAALNSEMVNGRLSFTGKRVLEVGL